MWLSIFFAILLINFLLQILLPNNTAWYDSVNRSPLTPPGYVFPIVWFFLYLIISYSYGQSIGTSLFIIWTIHIILNLCWSPLFFHYNLSLASLIVIGVMILTLIYILFNYYGNNNTLFYLNIIYLFWLLFAFYLNYYVYANN